MVHKAGGGHRKLTHSLAGIALFAGGAYAAGRWQATGAVHRQPASWVHVLPAVVYLALLYAAGFHALTWKRLRAGGHYGDLIAIGLAAVSVWQGWDLALVTAWRIPALAAAVAFGMAVHIAGDEITDDGCPLAWPLSMHKFHLLPRPLLITTGQRAERWGISAILIAGACVLAVYDTAPALITTPARLAGL